MTTSRLFQRISYYSIKKIINLIELFSTKYYMKALNKFLKYYGVNIINAKYIHKTVKFDDFSKISIGKNVVISFDCYLLTHDFSHQVAYSYISTRYGGGYEKLDNPLIKRISIGENTFIGCQVLILPDSSIGKNCIIGSGCIIKGVIPDNSVVVGNPAKIIGNIEDFGEKWLKQHKIKL